MLFNLLILLSAASAQTVTQTAPVTHNSVYSALSSECVSVIPVCVPTASSCAASICKLCTGLGITPSIEPCCAAATPTACFSDYISGRPLTYSTSSLPPPLVTLDSSAAACSSLISISSNCAAATPDFAQLEFSSQSSCVCSASGTYAPSSFDNFFSTCAAWVSTADPPEYTAVFQISGKDAIRTPCQHFATASSAFPTTGGSSSASTSKSTPMSTSSSTAPSKIGLSLHQKLMVSFLLKLQTEFRN